VYWDCHSRNLAKEKERKKKRREREKQREEEREDEKKREEGEGGGKGKKRGYLFNKNLSSSRVFWHSSQVFVWQSV